MSAEHPARTRTTTLLHTAVTGDAAAAESLDALVPLVYDELRAMASRKLAGERGDITLQTTELVHDNCDVEGLCVASRRRNVGSATSRG
ncbi:MAG: ECF-type sigma factor [Gemmatimonadaceae bacterium]